MTQSLAGSWLGFLRDCFVRATTPLSIFEEGPTARVGSDKSWRGAIAEATDDPPDDQKNPYHRAPSRDLPSWRRRAMPILP